MSLDPLLPSSAATALRHVACLLALVLAGCGGGDDADASAAPAPPPGPAANAFTVLPPRLALTPGGGATLVVLGSGGALAWTSSDPAVASVDAQGQVTARAEGSAVITASAGGQSRSSTVRVHTAQAPTGGALIAAALADGRISAEQALVYRVFASHGDARLPAEYDGAPAVHPEHQLLREVAGKLPTLSDEAQATLLPFLLPPIYQESWHAQQLAPAGAAAAQGRVHALVAARRTGQAAATVNCRVSANPTGWLRLSTAHFNIHYPDVQPATDAEANIAKAIAAVVEEAYGSITTLLDRFPVDDLNQPCNGGDGALDIYLNYFLPPRQLAATDAYPGRCEATPSFVSINSAHPIFRQGAAVDPTNARVLRSVKSVLAHEIAHVLQYTMDRQAACEDYVWIDEATAEWAMDHVDATFDFEDGKHVGDAGVRTGEFLLRYLSKDHLRPLEKIGADETLNDHGYAEYLFFQYLARQYRPETIRRIHDAQIGLASVEALEAALGPQGGMKTVWPDFARTLWIGRAEQVLDYWSGQDHYDYGLANIFQPAAGDAFAAALDRLKTLEVDQQGQPRASFELFRNAATFPTGDLEIDQRSLIYEHLRFSDPSVHSVMLVNPIAIIPKHDFIKLQAVKKIGGAWQAPEDWTEDATKSLCLDRKDERIEELILIVSNSEVDRAGNQPFRIPQVFPPRLSTSNVGCWRWSGSASTTATFDDGVSLSGTSTGSATVRWEVSAALPGALQFEPRAGFADGQSNGRDGACTFVETGERTTLPTAAFPAGRLDLNLDLELGIGGPPDRHLTAFDGLVPMQSTRVMTCPAVTVSSTGPVSFTWLQVDSTLTYAVSADGRTIEGQYIDSFPATRSTIRTLFKFTAERE